MATLSAAQKGCASLDGGFGRPRTSKVSGVSLGNRGAAAEPFDDLQGPSGDSLRTSAEYLAADRHRYALYA
jgi:hypothetical protein